MKIGVVVNHAEDVATQRTASYREIRQQAMVAEDGGLDSIWLFDHLLLRFNAEHTSGIWECWTMLSALADATSRVELGTLVLCNPFRNPALLAKMAHTLDEVSQGRLILGLGAGWHKPEFDAFGYSFAKRVDRFEEALQIVNPLLRGERVDFVGEHYQVEDCVMVPPGPRPAGIPLLIGAGQPRMLRLVAQYAEMWNTAWLGKPTELAERLALIQAACQDVGRDPKTMRITVGVQVGFPDLGEVTPFTSEPLTGTTAELAEAFCEYEAAGADHLVIMPSPSTETAVKHLAEAAQLYRSSR